MNIHIEDCFAYNYDIKKYTCELIHSIEPDLNIQSVFNLAMDNWILNINNINLFNKIRNSG